MNVPVMRFLDEPSCVHHGKYGHHAHYDEHDAAFVNAEIICYADSVEAAGELCQIFEEEQRVFVEATGFEIDPRCAIHLNVFPESDCGGCQLQAELGESPRAPASAPAPATTP